MTAALQHAIAEISKLPPDEQDRIGHWLLEELAAERRWDASFQASASELEKLATEALAEADAGRVTNLDPDKL